VLRLTDQIRGDAQGRSAWSSARMSSSEGPAALRCRQCRIVGAWRWPRSARRPDYTPVAARQPHAEGQRGDRLGAPAAQKALGAPYIGRRQAHRIRLRPGAVDLLPPGHSRRHCGHQGSGGEGVTSSRHIAAGASYGDESLSCLPPARAWTDPRGRNAGRSEIHDSSFTLSRSFSGRVHGIPNRLRAAPDEISSSPGRVSPRVSAQRLRAERPPFVPPILFLPLFPPHRAETVVPRSRYFLRHMRRMEKTGIPGFFSDSRPSVSSLPSS
jgi:hypothetical protein